MSKAVDFIVERENLRHAKFVPAPDPERVDLGADHALLRVDAFAFTANNITYAVFGDAMQYWNFFPGDAADKGDDTVWGRIPVWGFGDVVESRTVGVDEGRRLYGYFPMSTDLVVSPGKLDARGFRDLTPHRQPMAAVYNRYVFADGLSKDLHLGVFYAGPGTFWTDLKGFEQVMLGKLAEDSSKKTSTPIAGRTSPDR